MYSTIGLCLCVSLLSVVLIHERANRDVFVQFIRNFCQLLLFKISYGPSYSRYEYTSGYISSPLRVFIIFCNHYHVSFPSSLHLIHILCTTLLMTSLIFFFLFFELRSASSSPTSDPSTFHITQYFHLTC